MAQIETRWQIQSAGELGHPLGGVALEFLRGIVDRGSDQILEEVLGLLQRLGRDLDASGFVTAIDRDLDHAGTGLAGDFGGGELGLQPLHRFLRLLRLPHQLTQSAFHRSLRFEFIHWPSRGCTDPGRTVTPNAALSACTWGSSSIAASAARCRSARAAASAPAGLSPAPATPTSMLTRKRRLVCAASARSIAPRRSSTSRCLACAS